MSRTSFLTRISGFRLAVGVLAAMLAAGAAYGDIFGDQFGGKGGFGGGLGGFGPPNADPVTVSAQFTAATADRPAVLMITADVEPDWHIYSLTQPAGGPQRTRIELTPSDQYKPVGDFAAFPKHSSRIDQEAWVGLEIQEHADRVTWYVPIELAQGVEPGAVAIEGQVKLQACKGVCLPIDASFTAGLGDGVPIGPIVQNGIGSDREAPLAKSAGPIGAAATELGTPNPVEAVTVAPAAQGEPYDLTAIRFAETAAAGGGSLAWYLLLAFVGGLVLNLMPCVLPVIGLKVMSFVEQSGHSRAQAFALNVWYSLGMMAVFWLLGFLAIAAGLSWGQQFSSVAFNVTMASVVFVMALSLLGVWEIPIPGFVGSGKAQEAASKEGALGAFLKGVITTLLATPCIGPGMGAALGWAVKQPPGSVMAVFTALGVGMASPYLLIGAKPELVKFLPRPGAWMETFKQLMGFVLLGTVLFLLSILPSHYLLPSLALLTCLGFACWVYAKTPVTATSSEKSQTWALCSAITVAGAVFAFGWLHPLIQGGEDESWRPFSLVGLQQLAVDEGKTVLVDFGADWCANCKVLEKTVLHTEPVEQAISQKGVVTMYADNTSYPPEIQQTIQALGANGVPLLAVFPGGSPYNPIVFRDGYTQQKLIDAINQAVNAETTASLGSETVSR